MKSRIALNDGCINLCSTLQWNWMQFLPWVTGMTVAEIGRKFSQWIGEIERADGTMDFRWALIIPRDPKSRELYVLVGGLSSGSWWFWTRRWAAIMGDRELRAGLIYGSPWEKRRLASVLKELLAGKRADFELRLGPRTISCSRTMDVDESGMPPGGAALLAPALRQRSKPFEQLTLAFPVTRDSAKRTSELRKNKNREWSQ